MPGLATPSPRRPRRRARARPLSICLSLLGAALLVGPRARAEDLRQASATEVLAAAHQGQDPQRRAEALDELARRGDARGVAAVHSALSDPQVSIRHAAVRLVGALGKRGRPALRGLLKACSDPAEEVRASAVWALAALDDDRPEWGRLLIGLLQRDPSARVRIEAARCLGRFPSLVEESLPLLAAAIEAAPPEVGEAASLGLRRLGTKARAIEPRLRLLLGARELPLPRRLLVLRALGGLQEYGVGALFAARESRELTDAAEVELRTSILGRSLLKLESVSTPVASMNLIDQVTVYDLEVLRTLVTPLAYLLRQGQHPIVRTGAANLLASLGSEAGPALASYGEALQDSAAQASALEGISKLSSADQVRGLPWIQAALDQASDSFGLSLLRYLGETPSLGRPGLEVIGEALQWGTPEVRRAAARALGQLGARAAPRGPLLSECLRLDRSQVVRLEAAKALLRLGEDPLRAALPDLRSFAESLHGPGPESLEKLLQELRGK